MPGRSAQYPEAIGNASTAATIASQCVPWNRFATMPGPTRRSHPRAELASRASDLLSLDAPAFAICSLVRPIKRTVSPHDPKCLIAAGNSRDGRLRSAIERHLESSDPVIADAAAWAIGRL